MVGSYVLPRFSVSFPKTGFLLTPKRREPPIEIFMGSAEVVYFADGFVNLVKKSSRIFVAMLQKKMGRRILRGRGLMILVIRDRFEDPVVLLDNHHLATWLAAFLLLSV